MAEKLRIFWGTEMYKEVTGNPLGYDVHTKTLKAFLDKREDLEFVPFEKADCALYITTPEMFGSKPPITSFLFTMFEGLDLPEVYKKNIKNADYLIVPSHWVKELFSEYFDGDKIFVVPHGVEPIYTYKERNLARQPFRYLWVGAPNPRKGFMEPVVIWQQLGLDRHPELELYFKSTKIPNVQLQQCRNVILDGRHLPKDELVSLYHSAHCFLLPTRGEGFGLTLAEAMATGLPCIATNFSGVTEFFDDKVGFPVGFEFQETGVRSPIYGDLGTTRAAVPNITEIADKMIWVRMNYKEALKKGKLASIRIKTKFTWERSAERLVNGVNNILHRGNSNGSL